MKKDITMTDLEKAKAYDEALKRAENLENTTYEEEAVINYIFPQLRESEDERIRKAIFKALSKKDARDILLAEQIEISDALSYLEKQQEQKPLLLDLSIEDVETIKTALRESGFELASNRKVYNKLRKLPDSAYYLSTVGRSELYPDGTVARHTIGYLKKQKEQKPIEFKNDELVEIIKGEFEGFRNLLKKKGIDYEPQRGYWEGFARLFDSSAREYVKEQKEQKSAEWSEEDIKKIRSEEYTKGFNDAAFGGKLKEWSEEDEKRINSIFNDFKQDVIPDEEDQEWLKNRFKSLRPQQKREWSEEDEKNRCPLNTKEIKVGDIITYFKDGKKGIMLVSSFDSGIYPRCKWGITDIDGTAYGDWAPGSGPYYPATEKEKQQLYETMPKKVKDWLKPLSVCCPKSSDNWKPSEEQMEALKWAIECPSAINHAILATLYNDLKKL